MLWLALTLCESDGDMDAELLVLWEVETLWLSETESELEYDVLVDGSRQMAGSCEMGIFPSAPNVATPSAAARYARGIQPELMVLAIVALP